MMRWNLCEYVGVGGLWVACGWLVWWVQMNLVLGRACCGVLVLLLGMRVLLNHHIAT